MFGIGYYLFIGSPPYLELFQSINSSAGLSLVVASTGYVVSLIVTGQLEDVPKARLIFLKWDDPLPSNRAFSEWMGKDSRIDRLDVTRNHGPLPESANEQHKLWFRMYQEVKSDGSVEDSSKRYLLWRDATFVALILSAVCSVSLFWVDEVNGPRWLFSACSLIALVLFWRAARISGHRLVKQVLILNPKVEKSAGSMILQRP